MLGQSFGGFCTITYLSQAPQGLREAFITGGLPGLHDAADDVYLATYPLVAGQERGALRAVSRRTSRQARRIAAASGQQRRPAAQSGAPLTVEAFQTLGLLPRHARTGSARAALPAGGPVRRRRDLSDAFRYRVQAS